MLAPHYKETYKTTKLHGIYSLKTKKKRKCTLWKWRTNKMKSCVDNDDHGFDD